MKSQLKEGEACGYTGGVKGINQWGHEKSSGFHQVWEREDLRH